MVKYAGWIPTWLQEFEKEAEYMTEQKYDPKKFALSLGFTEVDAEFLAKVNADATNIRRVAVAKDLIDAPKPKVTKKEREAKAEAKRVAVLAEREAKVRREAEAEAADRPSYEGQGEPPSPETQQSLGEVAKQVGETVPPED